MAWSQITVMEARVYERKQMDRKRACFTGVVIARRFCSILLNSMRVIMTASR